MIISCESLYKRYTYNWIIKNVNSTFEGHQIYGISGANGSGKSTFLSLLSGFLSPSQGTIRYAHQGKDIQREEVFRYVSISAPYIELIEEYTVGELLDMYRKLKPLQDDLSTAEFLNLSYLSEDKHKPIKYFSSGMKQRVQLLLAIGTDCPLLLLDEPSSFLDEQAREWLYRLLKNRCSEKLVIMASNDTTDLEYCDLVYGIDEIQHEEELTN